jgi:3-oxoacyl-[acyl-carrier protein] reductase
MNLRLNNKRFLVTGASRGIGKAIAFRLLEEGTRVAITARGETDLNSAAEELEAKFGVKNILNSSADCTSLSDLTALKEKILEAWDGLDGVVANVGDGRSVNDSIPDSVQWDKIWKANFDSALLTSRVFLPLLKEANGCLLFISSITGVEALGAPVDYSTAKSAINAFAKNLSRKVAPDVRVNVIAPGNIYFPGGSWDQKMEKDEKQIKTMIKNTVPMQRFGKPEEIADTVAFLCSDKASFITGTVLRVDGGQTVSL